MPSYTLYYFNARGRAVVCRMLFSAAGVMYNDKRVEWSEWNTIKCKMPCYMMPMLEINGKTQFPQSKSIARYLAREYGFYGKTNREMAKIDYICDCFDDIFEDYMRMYHDRDGKMMLDRVPEMRRLYRDMEKRMSFDSHHMDMFHDNYKMHSDMHSMMKPMNMHSGMNSGMYSGMHSGMYSEEMMFERRQRFTETCRRILPFMEKTLGMRCNGNEYFMGDRMTMADMMCYCVLENPIQEYSSMLRSYPKLMALRNRISSHSKLSSFFKRRYHSDF